MNLYEELDALAEEGLTVIPRYEQGDKADDDTRVLNERFVSAIASRAFSSRGVSLEEGAAAWPKAVLITKTAAAVQTAVQFCATRKLKVSIRCGGHSWYSENWLHGDQTILLDVGDLNSIDIDPDTRKVSVGPGAKGNDVLEAVMPHDLFFPCGHCPGVPVGGFILGGGYGLGFPKYGLTSAWVSSVDVVLASGELVTVSVKDGKSERDRAIGHLLKGSHTGFPGVITKYHFATLPPLPKGVLMGMAIYDLAQWRKVLKVALDIQFRGDKDALSVETTVIFGHAPPPIAEATNVHTVAMLSLLIYGETEDEARLLWNKYSAGIGDDTLVPMDDPALVSPNVLPDMFGASYPAKARYESQVHSGNALVHDMSDDEIAQFIEPIVDMYQTPESAPPAPSHSIVVPVHRSFADDAERGALMATGHVTSLVVGSLAIHHGDAVAGEQYKKVLTKAFQNIIQSPAFGTSMAEGDLAGLGVESAFAPTALADTKAKIALLDPNGVFSGFPRSSP